MIAPVLSSYGQHDFTIWKPIGTACTLRGLGGATAELRVQPPRQTANALLVNALHGHKLPGRNRARSEHEVRVAQRPPARHRERRPDLDAMGLDDGSQPRRDQSHRPCQRGKVGVLDDSEPSAAHSLAQYGVYEAPLSPVESPECKLKPPDSHKMDTLGIVEAQQSTGH